MLVAASELVLVLIAAIVEAVILDVCRVELYIAGVTSALPKSAAVPIVEPKILMLLPKFATPSVDMLVDAVTLPIISVERLIFKDDSAKISCVKLALEKTDMPA